MHPREHCGRHHRPSYDLGVCVPLEESEGLPRGERQVQGRRARGFQKHQIDASRGVGVGNAVLQQTRQQTRV